MERGSMLRATSVEVPTRHATGSYMQVLPGLVQTPLAHWVPVVQGAPLGERQHATHVPVATSQMVVGSAQSPSVTHCTQEAKVPRVPLQTPPFGHGWFGLLAPAGSTPHSPTVPAAAQVLHVPLHAPAQQTPSSQLLV
jgi:hypothetical protein